jgi:type IV pilus assembly protein PilY1
MRARHLKLFALVLALAAVLPLAGDAAIPVPPASQAACFNTADQIPSPAPVGDETFFKIPGGVPNIMVLLDTSGSMFGLPRDVTYPAWSADNTNRGTCTGHWLNGFTPVNGVGAPDTTRAPFDNGFNNDGGTYDTIDDPSWGLKRCQAKQAKPTGDNQVDYCLFRPDSFYKAVLTASDGGGWDSSTARVYNANPCGAISANSGPVLTDYLGAPAQANNLAQCQSCLATAGFYVMNPRRQTAATTWANTSNQVVFAGWFLNAFPPKYVAARKVVKDLLRLDATPRPTTDAVRFGLAVFNGATASGYATTLRAGDGGKLVVPLGPNCDESFPVSRPAFATARQTFINAVNATTTATDWNDTLHVNFGGNTPLAESLFNVGQYYSNTGSSALYTSLFTNSWNRATFAENAAGSVNASWAAAGKNQHSFCWACQQSSVVVVTDGAPNQDSNLPASTTPAANHLTFNNDFRKWSNSTVDCPACGNDLSGSPANAMHKVAYFLSQTDLRPDLANGSRPQTVSTYTISFGINAAADAASAAAVALLSKTADLGNGIFANSSSGQELADALTAAVSDVVARATSFASANANSLQTSKTSGVDSYLGRFRPNSSPFWEGHLFASGIFDEFGEGCDESFGTAGQKGVKCGIYPSKNPNIDGDEDSSTGKAICKSAYVVDKECDPVIEDSTGAFKKGAFDATTHQLISTPDDAVLFWDAGKVLSDPTQTGYRSADESATNKRTIYTVIDVNGDDKFTAADGLVEFSSANAAALAPLMNLPALAQTSATALPSSGSPAVIPWCNTWLNGISVCGLAPLPACPNTVAAVRTKCAEQIINFYRGWDVMDWDADHCAGPGNYYNTNGWGTCTTAANCGGTATCVSGKCKTASCAGGEQRDRVNDSRAINAQEFWKLGDIFHSAPVVVKAPADKFTCKIGINNQCLLTLFSALGTSATTATPLEKYGAYDAYDQHRREKLNTQQVVLVGANDAMLHAFDAGIADTSKPANTEGQYPLTPGYGTELWAFIPPEMLPHLKDGLNQHHYFVDGNTMVRDVWFDSNGDGTKQKEEFRTVAVISERGGGTHFTALDVTDRANPKFLWTFPQLGTEDSKLIGQTWSLFPPRPPPILPVRLKLASGSGKDPLNRGFEERWVVALNGGYDPTLVRGRVVWLVDAITGQVLWRWTDASFKAMRGDLKASMLPVAATIGGMDIGKADQGAGLPDTDGYFDTLTWGDIGGNLFVARLYEPGIVNPGTGLVTNWTAARAFEANRKADDTHAAANRGQFFFMTSNFLSGASKLMTLVGGGNQEQLMQTSNNCGPNNVLGCCASGCTVAQAVTSTTFGTGSCTQGGTFQCASGALTYTPATTTACGAGFACGATDQKVTLTFNCGAAGTPAPMVAQVSCGSDGICSTDNPFATSGATGSFSTAALNQPLTQNRAYAIWSYGKETWRLFDDAASALAFEKNRTTDVPFTGCGGAARTCQLVETSSALVKDAGTGMGLQTTCRDGTSKCWAEDSDNGWMYSYGKWCPLASCSPATWTDEKSGSAPTVFRGCTEWSGFRPTGSAGGTDPCTASTGTPTSIRYRADVKSGVPRQYCGVEGTVSGRAAVFMGTQKNAYAPPQSGSIRVVVNEKGQVNYSTLKIETGTPAEKQGLGTRSSISEPLYWLEVPRELHSCRHVDPTTCQ